MRVLLLLPRDRRAQVAHLLAYRLELRLFRGALLTIARQQMIRLLFHPRGESCGQFEDVRDPVLQVALHVAV
jgi:hypothetical protein